MARSRKLSEQNQSNRPTGIIRTLPWYGAEDSKHTDTEKTRAYQRMMRAYKQLEAGRLECIYIALASKPTQEVLHCYLVVDGKVRVRANVSHYIPGDEIGTVKCFDSSERNAKWWAVLTAPVSWPPEDVPRRGFQGFHYVHEPLW